MLSREDYKDYLNQIVRIENRMSNIYADCVDRLKEDSIKRICSGLSDGEKRHVLIVNELIKLFDLEIPEK